MVKVVGQDNKVVVTSETPKKLVDPIIVLEGKNGADGKDGERGPEGLPGRDGVDGRDGKDGRDGIDGKDGKDGTSFWIEYDKKTNTLVFKNDGGKKNPDPIKLSDLPKAWGFGAGRGGGQVQADWNQTDKNNPTYIKNKPTIHNVSWKIVETLPPIGNTWTIYLVPNGEELTGNMYTEWIWVEDEQTQTLYWEQLGEEIDLSGYLTTDDIVSSVDSSSTNSKAVGAKLFYDICGDIEATLNAIRGV